MKIPTIEELKRIEKIIEEDKSLDRMRENIRKVINENRSKNITYEEALKQVKTFFK